MLKPAPAPTIDQLEARLKEPLTVWERVEALNALSEVLYERDAAQGTDLAREAIKLAQAIENPLAEAQALYCLGRNLYALGDYPAVFETQNDALEIFRRLGDQAGEARCQNLLGITHRQLADYGQALTCYDEALRRFRDSGDLRWQARVMSNIGNIEVSLRNFGAALELFDHALLMRREVHDEEGAGFDLNNAGFAHIQKALAHRKAGETESAQREAEEALGLLERALQIARSNGYKRLEAFCLQTMGEAYQAMARPERALALVDQFLATARACNDPFIEAYGLACLGEIRHQMGEHSAAVVTLTKALESFEAMGARDEVARVLRILSEACEAEGRLGEALAALRRAGDIEHALRSEEAERQASALAARRRLEQDRHDSERYKQLALEDSLTGLANRRQLDLKLEELLAEAGRDGTVLTVALADVDHFKGINDSFGHPAGDEVLRRVGEILRAHCRGGDIAGRYGGEEFVLVFRGLDVRAASEICERIRRAVESHDWRAIDPMMRVTLSIGLACSASMPTSQGILDAADHWLYEAKHHGRNQIQPVTIAAT
jgi:diguanylate cyclase (GGDEF)-like protein